MYYNNINYYNNVVLSTFVVVMSLEKYSFLTNRIIYLYDVYLHIIILRCLLYNVYVSKANVQNHHSLYRLWTS